MFAYDWIFALLAPTCNQGLLDKLVEYVFVDGTDCRVLKPTMTVTTVVIDVLTQVYWAWSKVRNSAVFGYENLKAFQKKPKRFQEVLYVRQE